MHTDTSGSLAASSLDESIGLVSGRDVSIELVSSAFASTELASIGVSSDAASGCPIEDSSYDASAAIGPDESSAVRSSIDASSAPPPAGTGPSYTLQAATLALQMMRTTRL